MAAWNAGDVSRAGTSDLREPLYTGSLGGSDAHSGPGMARDHSRSMDGVSMGPVGRAAYPAGRSMDGADPTRVPIARSTSVGRLKRRQRTALREGSKLEARVLTEADEDSKAVDPKTFNLHEHSHVHELTVAEKKLMFSYESLDYDTPVNVMYEREANVDRRRDVKRLQIAQWIVFALIGVMTGALAYALSKAVEYFTDLKFKATLPEVADGYLVKPFLTFLGISLLYVGFSSYLVAFVEPVSGGSGIPEIKGYLNGTNYQRFLRLKTLFCKAVGVIFSVSGGLIIGKEGPLVHSGAVFAANISHMTGMGKVAEWLDSDWLRRFITTFRNDKAKRDFVAGGAAAGVAAAFGAPVGGILFSLEEASSFWSTQLTWMVFLCSMLGTFMLNLLKVLIHGGDISFGGLISFGPPLSNSPFNVWETPFFLVLAVFGGLMGAAFNAINERICRWRRDELSGRKLPRWLEAVTIAGITAVCAFWLPYLVSSCTDIPQRDLDFQHKYHISLYEGYRCPEGQFNTMGTMVFATTEESIRGFFHNTGPYDYTALTVYFFVVFTLAVITYGIAVPSGLFVPCILMGCSFGRLFGEFLRHFIGPEINAGTYAVMGATAALGGVARMTISLTVIILETTQDVQFITPIMLVLMVSKWVGDLFNISLYDLHVELKCMPFVESAPSSNMFHLKAKDIMTAPAKVLPVKCTVREATELLDSCRHNGFPVVIPGDKPRYVGMIMRNQITIMIEKGAFGPEPEDKLHLTDFGTTLQSKYSTISDPRILAGVLDKELYFKTVMNPVPISVQAGCPLSRVFTLFRSLGIRHLCVVDDENSPLGMITRKEIMSSFDQDLF